MRGLAFLDACGAMEIRWWSSLWRHWPKRVTAKSAVVYKAGRFWGAISKELDSGGVLRVGGRKLPRWARAPSRGWAFNTCRDRTGSGLRVPRPDQVNLESRHRRVLDFVNGAGNSKSPSDLPVRDRSMLGNKGTTGHRIWCASKLTVASNTGDDAAMGANSVTMPPGPRFKSIAVRTATVKKHLPRGSVYLRVLPR
jgi:hypothetical protein